MIYNNGLGNFAFMKYLVMNVATTQWNRSHFSLRRGSIFAALSSGLVPPLLDLGRQQSHWWKSTIVNPRVQPSFWQEERKLISLKAAGNQ